MTSTSTEVGADMGDSLLFQQGASDRPFVNPVTSWSFLVTGESTYLGPARSGLCAAARACMFQSWREHTAHT